MSAQGNLGNAIAAAMRAVENAYKNTAGKDKDEKRQNEVRLFYSALRIAKISTYKYSSKQDKINALSVLMATAYSLGNRPCANCEKIKSYDKIMLERQIAKIYDKNEPEYPCDNCTEKNLPTEEKC